jgi:hypothetical protein
MPSASQKRFCAKGRSLLMVRMTTSPSAAAALLKARALAAQTPGRGSARYQNFDFACIGGKADIAEVAARELEVGGLCSFGWQDPIVWTVLPFNVIVALYPPR